MSRIAGLVERPDARDTLDRMLRASVAGWAPHARARAGHQMELSHGASLGWVGGGVANAFSDQRVACVMDGAVYNSDELGSEATDAGLVARLYLEHGLEGALRLLNGDFALALHDRAEGVLWLARDRFGVRPLYYLPAAREFAFASRPRALLGLPWVSPRLNRQYVGLFAGCHYRYFDNDPSASPYAEVAQLPAAHLLRVRKDDIEVSRWWSLGDASDLDSPLEDLAARYRELLLDSVRLRIETASGPGFTLSGGMDSSSVLASAVHLTGERQPAFSTVYKGSEYDETEEIRSMIESAVAHWHRVPVDDPDVLSLVTRMIDCHDEPVATATWLSHYVLCEVAASAGSRSIFGGLGGDELNAGEYEYFLYHFADLRAKGREDELAREVERWRAHHDHPVFPKNVSVMEEGIARLTDIRSPGRVRPDRRRIERYAEAVEPEFFDVRRFEPKMDHPFRGYLKNRTYQDLFRETAPCCLRAEDRQTAAFGMRNVDPFFDHRLVELMFRVPDELKIHDGVTKRLLRLAMRSILPEETRTRIKKTGWNAPADAWFSGEGREMLLDLVSSTAFRDRGIYRISEVRRLIDEHDEIVRSGRHVENHMMFLWQLVNLELWLRWVDALG